MCFGTETDTYLKSDLNDFALNFRDTNSNFSYLAEAILNASDSEHSDMRQKAQTVQPATPLKL